MDDGVGGRIVGDETVEEAVMRTGQTEPARIVLYVHTFQFTVH